MSMIQNVKNAILRLSYQYYNLICRLKGIRIGRDCRIDGMPFVRMTKGSSISLGKSVTLTSRRRHNPLLEHAVSLRTLTPEARIILGNQVGISGSRLVCCNEISIGDYTIIGPNSLIYDSEGHDYNPEVGWKGRVCYTGRPIRIGSRCFIGTGCIIMSGVTIGDRCLIAAGTVLKTNVPDGHKAEGNPAVITALPKLLGGTAECKRSGISPSEQGPESYSTSSEQNAEAAFLAKIREALELDSRITMADEFRNYDEWDSLAFLTLIAVLKDEYDRVLTADAFNNMKTWQEVYDWIGRRVD